MHPNSLNNNSGINIPNITDKEFYAIRDLVYSRIGIKLTEEKKTLVIARLNKLLRKYNLKSFAEYYRYLLNDASGKALDELANRISTNYTFFYREREHFEFFRDRIMKEICERHKADKDIRIWCAGCSSGEEAYTFIIEMMEYFKSEYRKWDAGLLATDISSKVLNIAANGIYEQEKLKDVPPPILRKYFTKISEDSYQVKEEIRKEITFRRFNLMNEKFPFKKKFDLISCRNVMIYFDVPTREKLIKKFCEWTVPEGYLFIGHSETIRDSLNFGYKYIKPAIYQKI